MQFAGLDRRPSEDTVFNRGKILQTHEQCLRHLFLKSRNADLRNFRFSQSSHLTTFDIVAFFTSGSLAQKLLALKFFLGLVRFFFPGFRAFGMTIQLKMVKSNCRTDKSRLIEGLEETQMCEEVTSYFYER